MCLCDDNDLSGLAGEEESGQERRLKNMSSEWNRKRLTLTVAVREIILHPINPTGMELICITDT